MKKHKSSSRVILFYSQKCNQTISVSSIVARKAAQMLEGDGSVKKYETQIPITINPSSIQLTAIRKTILNTEWVSDFKVEKHNGECYILEVVGESELNRLATVEKLELSRRHWNAEGYPWKVAVIEGE